jgi:hypothetical protein
MALLVTRTVVEETAPAATATAAVTAAAMVGEMVAVLKAAAAAIMAVSRGKMAKIVNHLVLDTALGMGQFQTNE